MAPLASILQENFTTEAGELCVGGIPVSSIAKEFGTPLYVYDAAILRSQLSKLSGALGEGWNVYYSVKANPAQQVLRVFLKEGCGLEVASVGEFQQAVAAGCDPSRILFAGPGKRLDELRYVVTHGIGEIHVESSTEIKRLQSVCKVLSKKQRISVRVNPTGDAQGGAMRMGGKPLQFGVDEEILDSVIAEIVQSPNLDLQGLHLFAGTQILNAADLLPQYKRGIEIAARIAAQIDHPLSAIDFGGGLGIPYFDNDQALDLTAVGNIAREIRTSAKSNPLLSSATLIVEPGRFLAGPSGVYVSSVIDIKDSRSKRFLIVDGGMHHHLAASGNLGQTIKRNYPIAALTRLNEPSDASAEVVGPLCTPLDVLGRATSVPATVEIGDLIGVFQSGAYGRSASPMQFLSHDGPAEVMVDAGKAFLIRERGSISDYLDDQQRPKSQNA
jgi:diaminopimelate decarboxylase